MAKKKTDTKGNKRLKLVELYKKYVLTRGQLPATVNSIMEFGKLNFEDFKSQFESLDELEVAIILLYFKQADDLLQADDEAKNWDSKDKHSAFLYLLVEQASGDEIFLREFVQEKRKSPSFMTRFGMILNAQTFASLNRPDELLEKLGPLGLNPKKSVLTNHAMSVLWFFTFDTSDEKQDTDAFIEKTTDLLFRLTDTSTISSIFDLGKFMVTRRKETFSWK